MTAFDKVRSYYGQFDEWARLDSPAGRLEFERALAILDKRLPPRSRILDLGGGPGRYAIELARRGHRVCLADLSPQQLEVARARIAEAGVAANVESVLEVNATDLGPYPEAAFDAVVAFGPFYHLAQASERTQAARELARVLKDDGLALVSFIPRLAGLAGLIARAAADAEQVSPEAFQEVFETGVFRNSTDRGFQEGWYAGVGEVEDLFATAGIACVEVVSLRGIVAGHEAELQDIQNRSPSLYDAIRKAIESTAEAPAVVALSGHALYIGRKART